MTFFSLSNLIDSISKIISWSGHTVFIFGAGYLLHQKIMDHQERQYLNSKRWRKQKERKVQFNHLEKLYPLTEEFEKIIQLNFQDLQNKLQSRQLSAKIVLQAFVAKSLVITKEFNCITEFVPQMWKWAEKLDNLEKVKGPLHGMPICIKDDHNIEGMDTTHGLSINLFKSATKNCVVVQTLLNLGAIPFCKTNLPQTVFSVASENPIFGLTKNPLNKNLSPGGSSSGTACLVRAGGAVFGTGSDMGGSLRIPAHMCGLTSLRSTIGRLSNKDIVQAVEGAAGVAIVPGILAKRAETLAKIFELQTANNSQNTYDPLIPPVPWNENLFNSKKPLRIGYFTSLPLFPSLGDTPGVIEKAKATLEKMGHHVVPFQVPNCWRSMKIFASLQLADGGNKIYQKLKNDVVALPGEKFLRPIWHPMTSILTPMSKFLRPLFHGKREFSGNEKARKSEILWDYLKEQEKIKYEILEAMTVENLDLILSPVSPFPACPFDNAEILLNAHVYCALWSFVDFPCGVVPFGVESCANIEAYDDEGDFYLKLAKKDIKLAQGMPIGVQIIGKPFKEELVLRILVDLDDHHQNLQSSLA